VSGVYAAAFGQRLREYGADVLEVRVPYDEALDPLVVAEAMDECQPIDVVSLVHLETPSGIENPLGAISAVAHEYGALVIADVVSSLGGTTLLLDEWNIDLAVAGSQKCLAGPPGLSLIGISSRAWQAMRANPLAPRGSVLSLLDWKDRWIDGDRASFPSTPPVAEIAGMHAALTEIFEQGGVDAATARHRRAARATRAGVKALGLELWARNEADAASCVTAVRPPSGVRVQDLLAHIRARYGVMLSGSRGELAERVIRLGHMGPACRSLYPVVALCALGRGLSDFGALVDVAAGAGAVMDELTDGAVAAPATITQ
jgi:pyridoxamine--pyruvate transaminase